MDLNDVPATGNYFLLHDVLREDWKFNGFVVSDAMAIGSLVTHGYARDREDAAYLGVPCRREHGHGELQLPERIAEAGEGGPRHRIAD